jgi:proteasome lid subunit RPN8/RPN11
MRRELLEALFEGARRLYPKESIMLLRGKGRKGLVEITDLLVPPFATYGHGFANVPLHFLPMDFSIVGTMHSHPSGNFKPSSADLNHFFGKILMVVAFPFQDQAHTAVYDRLGRRLTLQITE